MCSGHPRDCAERNLHLNRVLFLQAIPSRCWLKDQIWCRTALDVCTPAWPPTLNNIKGITNQELNDPKDVTISTAELRPTGPAQL